MDKKEIQKSEFVYSYTKKMVTPIFLNMIKPIILNDNNIPDDNHGIIFAPNHVKTIDPFAILSTTPNIIHWAALKRFFDAEDSIFNNNKNVILRHLTSYFFHAMGFIPIDRDAKELSSNVESLKMMRYLLKSGKNIGIFPEGTTNKHLDEVDLGEIKSGISLARTTSSWVQPIAIVWNQDDHVKNKVIINYRTPFFPKELDKQETEELWKKEVLLGIQENKAILEKQRTLVK